MWNKKAILHSSSQLDKLDFDLLFFLLLFCHIERKNTKDFPLLISKKEGVKGGKVRKDERESVKDEKREGERKSVSKMRREKTCVCVCV